VLPLGAFLTLGLAVSAEELKECLISPTLPRLSHLSSLTWIPTSHPSALLPSLPPSLPPSFLPSPLYCKQVAIPLALRPGSEAFEEEKGRLEEMRRNRGGEEEEEE